MLTSGGCVAPMSAVPDRARPTSPTPSSVRSGRWEAPSVGRTLEWTLERAVEVLDAAGGRLADVGLALGWAGDGCVVVVRAAHVATSTANIELRTVERSGLNVPQARVLAKLAQVDRLSRTEDAGSGRTCWWRTGITTQGSWCSSCGEADTSGTIQPVPVTPASADCDAPALSGVK